MDKKIWVYADWKGLGDDPVFMGTLLAVQNRGKEIFSFTYEPEWLKRKECMVLDPGLGLFQGPQYPEAGKPNFGLFLDSSPDRWGRVLMDRREAALAAKEGRQRLKLLESGYLLGVHDGQRLGVSGSAPIQMDRSLTINPGKLPHPQLPYGNYRKPVGRFRTRILLQRKVPVG